MSMTSKLAGHALIWLICLIAGTVAAAELPPEGVGKIIPETWNKVVSGEVRDLLVLFGDSSIDTEAESQTEARKLHREDDAILALRSERYRQLKDNVMNVAGENEIQIRKSYRHVPMSFLRFGSSAALTRLLKRKEVVAVYEDIKLYPVLAQSLPLVGQPPVAQVMGRTGAGFTVAVLDTGVNYTRSEFGSCSAPGVPAGCKVVAALDTAPEDNALDAYGHGTEVAATVAGIAPGAGIAAVDVFNGSSASSSDVVTGIDWAIANRTTYNIAAINLSLGDGTKHTSACSSLSTNPFRQAIINARNAGILTIVASGNEAYTNGLASPACTPEAISVGAVYDANVGSISWSNCSDTTTAADKVTCFSNSASYLNLLAPGALITVAGATVGGTSFAAPFVAGAVAVMAQAFPGDNATTRQGRLTTNGTMVTDSRNGISTPRLNFLAAQGAPTNDNFAAASALTGSQGQAMGWNLNAGKETGEPLHAGDGGGKSVWWQWTAPAAGTLNLDTHGSGFNTLLALYTGTSVAALTPVASNDDDGSTGNTSGIHTAVTAGTTYYIAVDGKAGASGAITLNWSMQLVQTIAFDPIGTMPAGTTVSLTATASSGLPVSFSTQTPAVCTLSGNVAILLTTGICTIAADQSGNMTYAAAPTVTRSFSADKQSQSISFAALSNLPLNNGQTALSASASSGLVVTIASLTPATCNVTGNVVNLMAVGICTLQASQEGNGTYAAATPVTQSFSILSATGDSTDGDVPLPAWALLLLGAGMFGMLRRR
jgi:MYXO-CTERM domain-containing protein